LGKSSFASFSLFGIAVRLALRQSYTLWFLANRNITTRLALGQSFALFFPRSGMKIAIFTPENGLISCKGTIKLRPA
jgi:hypothetical protein